MNVAFAHLNREIDLSNYWVPQSSDRYGARYCPVNDDNPLLHQDDGSKEVQRRS